MIIVPNVHILHGGVGYTDDELGNNNIESSTSTNRKLQSMQVVPTADGFIDSIALYYECTDSTDILVGVYDEVSGIPTNRLGLSAAVDGQTSGAEWKTYDLISPVAITNGVAVWLAFDCEDMVWRVKDSGGSHERTRSTSFGTLIMPDPYGAVDYDPPLTSRDISVYANVRYET